MLPFPHFGLGLQKWQGLEFQEREWAKSDSECIKFCFSAEVKDKCHVWFIGTGIYKSAVLI